MNIPLQKTGQRIISIDILRGAVMLIMALDHVRDFFHIDAIIHDPTNLQTTTPVLFLTRWITHFCAPVFVFLSGISASIAGQKRTKSELSLFLITRGLWLVFIEVSVMTFALTFNPFYNVFILEVIWAIGCSMIILGLLVRTSLPIIIVVGCIIFFSHNILDYVNLPKEGAASIWWNVLVTGKANFYPVTSTRTIGVLYAVLPWTCIMLLGYGFGNLYSLSFPPERRKKILFYTGIVITGLFLFLRLLNHYGDPAPWSQQKDTIYTVLSFLNTTKYPVSLQFACMTLGPALIILSFAESARGWFANILTTYGKVPFFYFIVHFYLIHGLHVLCVLIFYTPGDKMKELFDFGQMSLFRPSHFGVDLWAVYLIWLFVITVMYWPCKWFVRYKQTHKKWWLSYV